VGAVGVVAAGPDAAARGSVGGSPAGGERGAVANSDGIALAGPAAAVRVLEDRVQPAPAGSADGTWSRALDGLRVDCDRDWQLGAEAEWVVGADSTVVRAHQHAAGARHRPPEDIALLAALTGGTVE
jgi:hypothetical protein